MWVKQLTCAITRRMKAGRKPSPRAAWLQALLVLNSLMAPRLRRRKESAGSDEGSEDEGAKEHSPAKKHGSRNTDRPFRCTSLEHLKPDAGAAEPSPSTIQRWFRSIKETIRGEGLQWIIAAADAPMTTPGYNGTGLSLPPTSTDPVTLAPPPPIAGSKLPTADEDMSDSVMPEQGEVTLEAGWETRGDEKIDEVTDKELVEYAMGHDVQFTIGTSTRSARGKRDRVIMIDHHVVGEEMKIGASHGNPNLRGLIKKTNRRPCCWAT